MSKLTDDAKMKLAKECEKKDHLIPFEEYLTDMMDDNAAEKILQESKTLSGAYSEIQSKARQKATGNCAMIRSDEVFGWLREYYGITKQKSEKPKSVIDIMDFM